LNKQIGGYVILKFSQLFSIKSLAIMTTVSTMILSGCTSSDPASTVAKDGKIQVVTTFYPIYEFTRNVAGEYANVVGLIPAGAEPHDWEPTAKDVKQIKESNLFVYNGGGIEYWVDKTLKSVKKDSLMVVETTQRLELMEGMEEEDEHDSKDKKAAKEHKKVWDPHIWLDPVLAQKQVAVIQAGLEKADPAHKEGYKKNADAYIAKLQELDKTFQAGLSNVKRKEFVTQHAAFAYLSKRYGLTQIPIGGLSPEEEPFPGKMAEIVKFAKEHQVKTIFFEKLVNPKVAETVAKEIGAKTAVLNSIEGLTDEDKTKNLDYIGLMKNNLEALKTVLNE
jgi:zinc transport system substrate-binding protein